MSTKKERATHPVKDPGAQLEEVLAKRKTQKYALRLFVREATPKSTRAIQNLRKLCERYLKDRYELEVIDIVKHPEKARSEQVIAVPTLIKQLPPPLRKLVGDLSDSERVLVGLEIKEDTR